MPPKRKRAETTSNAAPIAETSSRGTRSSARIASGASGTSAAATNSAATKKTANKTAARVNHSVVKSKKSVAVENNLDAEDEVIEPSPPTKKSKAAKSTAAPKPKKAPVKAKHIQETTSTNYGGEEVESGPSKVHNTTTIPTPVPAPAPKPTPAPIVAPSQPATSSKSKAGPVKHTATPTLSPNSKFAPYSASRALSLFNTYTDQDDKSVIGPEGFQQLCTDADISLEGALPLILAWQLSAKEMAKFRKDEWVKGMEALQISSLPQLKQALKDIESLLILGNEPLTRSSSSSSSPSKIKRHGSGGGSGNVGSDPYNRQRYWEYTSERKGALSKLYMFCFTLAKPEQARNIDMETATAFWSVLLIPQYPIMADVIEFINEKGSVKGANKDLWSMMLEFSQSVKPSLENYEADGAWPTLLDDFVAWKKAKTGVENGNADD